MAVIDSYSWEGTSDDGAAPWSEQDLSSDGFGLPWGQTRTWTSGVGYASHGLNGAGWVDSNLPYLLQSGGTNTLVAVVGGTDARYFDWNGSAYVERFFGQATLTYDSTNSQYVLDAPDGSQLRFFDFSSM